MLRAVLARSIFVFAALFEFRVKILLRKTTRNSPNKGAFAAFGDTELHVTKN